jgi:hypothetical protein
MDSINIQNDFEKYDNEINMHPCYLFLGAETDETVLTDKIVNKRWSGIISNLDNTEISERFKSNNREVIIVQSKSEIKPNTVNLPFISLKALIHIDSEDSEEEQCNDFRDEFRDILQRIMHPMDSLYVIGYSEIDFNIRCFNKNICKNSITFFGMKTANLSDIAVNYKDKYGFNYVESSLDSVLIEEKFEDNSLLSDNEDSVLFYINGKVKAIQQYELMSTRSYITLANRFDFEVMLPTGLELKKSYFIKYLKSSSNAQPQWYGYVGEEPFAVKRNFQDGLQSIIECALNGDIMPDGKKYDVKKPIILTGAPFTSKTVTLGAIAYNIYSAKKYPVLYIKEDLLSLSNGEMFDNLVTLR